ncbi:hypothetical protein PMZ80_011051 [Knufia obscura]|uniref:Uncharacterized protein n=2 Tax=Knufia TaxID=430999 RepID=A0AAN8I3B5_9EURO|nr:hypothetical protein PMZ80_011051 [Knufia obscura]KAK5948200.1 hypothetical protein OHC33_010748 [Knufia fluminis]
MAAQLNTDATFEPSLTRSPTSKDTLHSVTALARFEFEPGRGNDGTKIMMVEWQDDNKTRHKSGSWQVSWPGKKTTFAADDNPSDSTNRLYFLLPPGETVPPSIRITYQPPKDGEPPKSSNLQTYESSPRPSSRDGDRDSDTLHMTVHPLPAIFTPELGANAKASGKKGVLHTIWAKRRLQVLAREIRSETEFNLEGIALEMAMAEKQWIEQNFGIIPSQPKPQTPAGGLKLDLGAVNSGIASPPVSPGMQSPRSPGGRRLTDKLKGLSIMTNDKEYGNVNTPTREINPLSPEVGDMAVSSFSTFKGDRPVGKTPQTAIRRMMPISPPSEVTDDQAQSATASLAGIASGQSSARPDSGVLPRKPQGDTEGDGEDLFAVAMSPRSPDAPKSPFSLSSSEDIGGVSGGGAFSRIKGIQTK